jgi:spoIIIJ-associated protein
MNDKRTSLEIIAPTIEDAIEEGLTKLGVTEDSVDIEILDEGTKGLFGLGSRQCRIRLTFKGESELEFESATNSEDLPYADGKPVESQSEANSVPDEEDDILMTARETVEELLEKMRVNAKVTACYLEPDEPRGIPPVYVDIHGDDLSILIGRKAETLDALQYISRLIICKEVEQSVSLVVDVEGYRKRRENQIRKLAQRVAEQVVETGRSQALEPMPPNERRLIHIELRDHAKVYTESTNEGDHRKVVIHPKI